MGQLRYPRWRALCAAAVIVLAGGAIAAPPAASRGLDASERAAREIWVSDASGARQRPFAGFSIFQPTRREWTVFTIYVMFREASDGENRRRESYWLARRSAGAEARKGPEHPEWATSERCPALDAAVRAMGDAIDDRLEMSIPDQGDASDVDADPTQFKLWTDAGRFHGTGHSASIVVGARSGSPLADWIQESAAAVAGCWTSDAPAPVLASTR